MIKPETQESPTHKFRLEDLTIRTKDSRLVKFVPNAVQQQYLDELCPGWRDGDYTMKGKRELVLKARQFGFSTLILALFFLDSVNNPARNTVVIAHDELTTKKLFGIVQRFYQHLDPELRPSTSKASSREYYWPELDSGFFVGTAGSPSFGRGGTVTNMHGSEAAFWPDARAIMAGLLQSVPIDGNVFLESTANGFGNYYEEEYNSACEGDSNFIPRFYAWWQHEEYRLEVTEPLILSDDEFDLQDRFSLSVEQLAWRRVKLKELRELFPQEYPATAVEAFITTGNPYFDREVLKAMHTPDPTVTSMTTGQRLGQELGRGLLVWEPPVPGRSYILSADTAEGVDPKNKLDFDSADVIDTVTWEQVAHLHGRWDTHEYGLMLAELGRIYNDALLVVERNNHGHAVLNAIIHTAGYPEMDLSSYHGLYYHEEYDERKKLSARKPGYPTTVKSKIFALDALATAIVQGDITINSKDTVRELIRFVRLPGGKAGGEGSSKDDRVMSLALGAAVLGLRLAPEPITSSPISVGSESFGASGNMATEGPRLDSTGLVVPPKRKP